MTATTVRIYGYRWVVLLAFMAVIFANQILKMLLAEIEVPWSPGAVAILARFVRLVDEEGLVHAPD
jgi:hypothetical protein